MILAKRSYLLLAGGVLLTALTVAAVSIARRPDPVTVPTGTTIHVRLDETLASNRNNAGDEFDATVSEPVVLDNKTAIPEGAKVKGRVIEARESGHLKGVARLRLTLASVDVNGKSYDIETSGTGRTGGNHKKRNLGFIGGSGAGGALIGAIAAGGKGALIEGPIGAGAGTAVAYFTGKKDIRLPAESPLTFELVQPVTISVQNQQQKSQPSLPKYNS
jgi:hypothetical protein